MLCDTQHTHNHAHTQSLHGSKPGAFYGGAVAIKGQVKPGGDTNVDGLHENHQRRRAEDGVSNKSMQTGIVHADTKR